MKVRKIDNGALGAAPGRVAGTVRGRYSDHGSQVVSYAKPQYLRTVVGSWMLILHSRDLAETDRALPRLHGERLPSVTRKGGVCYIDDFHILRLKRFSTKTLIESEIPWTRDVRCAILIYTACWNITRLILLIEGKSPPNANRVE